jgi:hypothetical protein
MVKDPSTLTREDISRIADSLTQINVNLLSVALKSADLPDAQKLVIKTFDDTGIDITDTKGIGDLTDGPIDELQRYETSIRSELISYVGKYYEANIETTRKKEKEDKTLTFLMKITTGLYVFFGLFIVGILWLPMPEQQMRYVDYILGFLSSSIAATITAFWFGKMSNKNDRKESSDKNEQE